MAAVAGRRTETWQSIAARKKEERLSRIPEEWRLAASVETKQTNVLHIPQQCGILTEDELHLTEHFDATALLSGLSSGLVKSVSVVTAFCKRAAIAQQVTNCLTEILFQDALTRAKELDEYFARTGKPLGPLHGLPISLKDSFQVKGYDASLGVAAMCFAPSKRNSALVDMLLSLGAVLYCKTNVPLTLMALDTHNNVFGRTMNPANRALTAGGSSGGEGALIAMRGSVLGMATDIGGSIRVPSFCNGLFGVKPSHGRVPYAGQASGGPISKIGIESTAGPIAVSLRDCEMFLRVICDANSSSVDPDVFAQRWQQQESLTMYPQNIGERVLRVGIVRTDGHVTPLPPIQGFLDEVSQALSKHPSFEVIEVNMRPLGPKLLKVFNGIVSIEGANSWFDLLEKTGEPLSPWMQSRLRRRPEKSLDEIRNLHAQRADLLTTALDMWRESGGYWETPSSKARKGDRTLDVIVCPPAPHPVAAIDQWNSANYTSAFNILDYAAGILPLRQFGEGDLEGEVDGSEPLNGWDKINREMWRKSEDRRRYVGSTLALQVVAPRLMERKLVESMALLDGALSALGRGDGRASKL